jgi:arginase
MTRFVVVPQWQGSAASRAMRLIDGAHAIAGDLPRAATTIVDVPLEAGEELGTGVRRWGSLRRSSRAQLEAGRAPAGERTVIIGGDAGVAATAARAAMTDAERTGSEQIVVVWFAAHPGLHDTSSAPGGAYESMAARAVIEDVVPQDLPGAELPASRLILAGARGIDPHELDVAARLGVAVRREVDPDVIGAAVAALAPSAVFVHVALDVLDPAVITGVSAPEPFGVDVATLTRAIAAVGAAAPSVGGALTGFAPSSPEAAVDDLGAILRIVGALA